MRSNTSALDVVCKLAAQIPFKRSRLIASFPKPPDWQIVGQSADHSLELAISAGSIGDLGSAVGKFLGRAIYSSPQQTNSGASYQFIFFEGLINCAADTYEVTIQELVNSNYDLVDGYYKEPEALKPQRIAPGTLFDQSKRFVCPKVSSASKATATSEGSNRTISFGTGWVVGSNHVVTAFHIVYGKEQIVVFASDHRPRSAKVLISDAQNDVVVLEVDLRGSDLNPLPLATTLPALGSKVFTIGYPMPEVLGLSPKVTSGEVSSVAGMLDDPRHLQISVPVQPGNSGGPLLNQNGEVVGVVLARLRQDGGPAPQNVNYAVKARYVRGLLDDMRVMPAPASKPRPGLIEDLVGKTKHSVVMVIAQ